ncbi:MAG: hypothetical protein ACUVSV_14790 [Armatimonadota bacterium]
MTGRLWIPVLLLACIPARAVPLHDFEDIGQWESYPDGGIAVRLQADTAWVKQGRSALRILYRDAPPHWGNIVASFSVPPMPLPSHSGWLSITLSHLLGCTSG